MLIFNYAINGSLHDYLQKKFINVTWHEKIIILEEISIGYLYF
jgi:hypothetical protein